MAVPATVPLLPPLGIPPVFPPPVAMLAFAVTVLEAMTRMGGIDLLGIRQERGDGPEDGQQDQPPHHQPPGPALPDIPS
jgi:hypothetical protein